ncbi:MAG: hypothetical protein GTO54_11755, partial [Nitrososphaeria archaeon]|nr:hypothetical protein [Nitrososphaeria archaeon]
MYKTRWLVSFLVSSVMVAGVLGSGYAADYVGAEKCMECHEKQYNEWRTSGHPYKLRTA